MSCIIDDVCRRGWRSLREAAQTYMPLEPSRLVCVCVVSLSVSVLLCWTLGLARCVRVQYTSVCVRACSGAPAPSVGGGKNLTARESAHGLDTYTYSRLTIRHARTQRDLEQQIATIKNSQQAAAATTNAAIAPMPARASSVPDPCSPLCSLRWHTPDGTIVRSILGPSSTSRLRSPISTHENHGFRT